MQSSLRRTVAYSLPWDDAPVDLRHLFAGEQPAGKHGFLTCRGVKMVFEDGTEARFWGTNFNSAANFPSHDYSEKVARRVDELEDVGQVGHHLTSRRTSPRRRRASSAAETAAANGSRPSISTPARSRSAASKTRSPASRTSRSNA